MTNNNLTPKKLLNSKWTAINLEKKEKYPHRSFKDAFK